MHVIYDVTTEPVRWASLYLLWVIALALAFFFGVIAAGRPSSQSTNRRHRVVYFSVAAVAVVVAATGTTFGFANRSKCAGRVEAASVIEGPIQSLMHGRSSLTHIIFVVGPYHFNTEPALFSGCGFVRSVTDVASLTAGEYVRVAFDGPRILRVWKREP